MRSLAPCVLMASLISGCAALGVGELDVQRLPDGRSVLSDNAKMWNLWMPSVDREVLREVSFRNGDSRSDPLQGRAQGGTDWNEYWMKRIRAVRTGQEHPQRYIDYIIRQRRAAGLPEIQGYSSP